MPEYDCSPARCDCSTKEHEEGGRVALTSRRPAASKRPLPPEHNFAVERFASKSFRRAVLSTLRLQPNNKDYLLSLLRFRTYSVPPQAVQLPYQAY